MGRVDKGVKCSVVGCGKQAIRSLSSKTVSVSELELVEGRRAYLCKSHYKEFKRKTKREKMLERWRYKG